MRMTSSEARFLAFVFMRSPADFAGEYPVELAELLRSTIYELLESLPSTLHQRVVLHTCVLGRSALEFGLANWIPVQMVEGVERDGLAHLLAAAQPRHWQMA